MKDITIVKAKPLGDGVIVTCKCYEEDVENDGLITTEKKQGGVMPYQTVVAVGDYVRLLKVGDFVEIDPTRFIVKRYKEGSLNDGVTKENVEMGLNLPVFEMNGEPHLLLREADIKYIITEHKEVEISNADIIE